MTDTRNRSVEIKVFNDYNSVYCNYGHFRCQNIFFGPPNDEI